MNVGKGRRMPKHFDIHGSDEILFEELGRYIFLCHIGFESLQLIEYDFILFLFGLGLTDAFDELFEFFREVTGGGCHIRIRNEINYKFGLINNSNRYFKVLLNSTKIEMAYFVKEK